MTIHIDAKPGDVAERVLLPGDPLRAKAFSRLLDKPVQYNNRRGMLGYTGYYQGRRVSVQGSGMGQASLGIYVTELVAELGVKEIIRVGTCGSLQESVGLREIIIAEGACTDSNRISRRFDNMNYAPIADWGLLQRAVHMASDRNVPVRVGNVVSVENFYNPNSDEWRRWSRYGVLGVEMESAELYTLAAYHDVKALSILTVSDLLYDLSQHIPADEKESDLIEMAEIALSM